jgi:hypothetical protein
MGMNVRIGYASIAFNRNKKNQIILLCSLQVSD